MIYAVTTNRDAMTYICDDEEMMLEAVGDLTETLDGHSMVITPVPDLASYLIMLKQMDMYVQCWSSGSDHLTEVG